MLARHGYAGATIQAVASEAELSPGLLHHHFSHKGDMLAALFDFLVDDFRSRFAAAGDPGVSTYIDAALQLGQRADQAKARCWVGVLAEALRNPTLFGRLRRYLDSQITLLTRLSGGTFDTEDSSALLAFVIGALVFGAFAPKRSAGFAARAAKRFARLLSNMDR